MPLFANGTGAFYVGSIGGNTTKLLAIDGSLTNGHCLQADGYGGVIDAGNACGSGSGGSGTVSSGTANQLAYYASTGTTVAGLSTANNSVLITSSSGVPGMSTTLPTIVQQNIMLSNLGATTVGSAVFTATSAPSAVTALGGTTVGSGVFTAASGTAAMTAQGITSYGQNVITSTSYASMLGLLGGAPLANPTFTGTATIPTIASGLIQNPAGNITVSSASNGAITFQPITSFNGTFGFYMRNLLVGASVADVSQLSTGTANSFLQQQLSDNNGSPTASYYSGNGVTNGLQIFAEAGNLSLQSYAGSVTSQTPSQGDNSTKIATTAFVQNPNNIGFQQPDTGAISTTVNARLLANVNLVDFCPLAGGASNAYTTCFQAAATALCNRTNYLNGGRINLPAEVINITQVKFCWGTYVHGSGRGTGTVTAQGGGTSPPFTGTFKDRAGTSGTLIQCSGSTSCLWWNSTSIGNYYDGGGMDNLSIYANYETGYVIEQDNLRDAVFENITIYQPTQAIYSLGGNEVRFRNIYLNYFGQTNGTSGLIDVESGNGPGGSEGGGNCGSSSDIYGVTCRDDAITFEDITAEAGVTETGGYCIRVNDWSATVMFRDIRFINCWGGIIAATTNTYTENGAPSFLILHDFQMDFCQYRCGEFYDVNTTWITGAGTYFHGSGNSTNDYDLIFNCTYWCGSPNTSDVWLTDGTIDNAQKNNILIGIPGVHIFNNNIAFSNLANNATPGPTTANIQITPNGGFTGYGLGSAIVANNTLCQHGGYYRTSSGNRLEDGIYLDSTSQNIRANDNNMDACRNAIIGTINLSDNLDNNDVIGPAGFVSGGCGGAASFGAGSTTKAGTFTVGSGATTCSILFQPGTPPLSKAPKTIIVAEPGTTPFAGSCITSISGFECQGLTAGGTYDYIVEGIQ